MTANWRVLTSGPCPRLVDLTTAEAKAHVENHAPLKRGWTGTWRTLDRPGATAFAYERFNSKGRLLPGYTITLRKEA